MVSAVLQTLSMMGDYTMKSNATHLRTIQKKYVTDSHLNKASSDRVMQNLCPYCTYAPICTADSADRAERVCLAKSSESHRTWIRVTATRNKVEIGETYGSATVLSMSHKDSNGYIYWNCQRGDQVILVRGDNLLRINKNGRAYNRGSSRNPDGTLHKYPNEHSSKYGCALEKTATNTIINDDGDHVVHKYEDRVKCRCGGVMRYDEYGEGICEECVGLARRNPKPCLDPDIKPHQPIEWMGPMVSREVSRPAGKVIAKHEPTKKEIDDDCKAYVEEFKAWCKTI